MAKIEDLIAQIPNEPLKKALTAEVKALKKTKKFGLVFEEHLPETVRLPKVRVREGAAVALKREAGNKLWRVKSITDGIAACERDSSDRQTANGTDKQIPVEDLVVVSSFGDAIYPDLVPIERVARGGPEKPWHVFSEEHQHVGSDGVFVRVGNLWSEENMMREPQERRQNA